MNSCLVFRVSRQLFYLFKKGCERPVFCVQVFIRPYPERRTIRIDSAVSRLCNVEFFRLEQLGRTVRAFGAAWTSRSLISTQSEKGLTKVQKHRKGKLLAITTHACEKGSALSKKTKAPDGALCLQSLWKAHPLALLANNCNPCVVPVLTVSCRRPFEHRADSCKPCRKYTP